MPDWKNTNESEKPTIIQQCKFKIKNRAQSFDKKYLINRRCVSVIKW